MEKLKAELVRLRGLKHCCFDDLDAVLRRMKTKYGHLFPKLTVNRKGSRFVTDFGQPELKPISLEKEHGSRDCIPKYYAKIAMDGIEDVVAYIEAQVVPPEPSDPSSADPPEQEECHDEDSGTIPKA